MSWLDYRSSLILAAQSPSFYALIMAAMRQADTDNLMLLEAAWPLVSAELRQRYDAPGGFLTEREAEKFGEYDI